MTPEENQTSKPSLRLGFGCASILGKVGRRESIIAIETALSSGITHFDVARSYGFGEAERLLGQLLNERRELVTVITKFGIRPPPAQAFLKVLKPAIRLARTAIPGLQNTIRRVSGNLTTSGFYSAEDATRSIEESLQALKFDYLDAVLIHEPPTLSCLSEELFSALDRMVKNGRLLKWGLAGSVAQFADFRRMTTPRNLVFQTSLADAELGTDDLFLFHSPFSRFHPFLERVAQIKDGPMLDWLKSVVPAAGTRGIDSVALRRLYLQLIAEVWPTSTFIVGMANPAHIVENAGVFSNLTTTLPTSNELRNRIIQLLR